MCDTSAMSPHKQLFVADLAMQHCFKDCCKIASILYNYSIVTSAVHRSTWLMGLLPCFLDHQVESCPKSDNALARPLNRIVFPTRKADAIVQQWGYTGTPVLYRQKFLSQWGSVMIIHWNLVKHPSGTADNAKAPAKPLTDILWYTWFLVPLGQNHCTYHGLTPYPGCKWKWTLNFFWRRLGQPFFCPLMLVQCCTGNRFHLGKVEKKTWCWLVIWAVKNPESTVGEWMAKLNCQDSRSSKFGCFDLLWLYSLCLLLFHAHSSHIYSPIIVH